jgi:four helix bundle protein
MSNRALDHTDLEVHQRAYALAMDIFELSKGFPKAETYSLTDQIRRSSRSVTANIAEAWEKRRYEGSFIAKLIDSCGEVAETKNWLSYARDCGYAAADQVEQLLVDYQGVLRTLRAMISHSSEWCGK